MNIGINRSTIIFIIADPPAVLKDSEIYIEFSGVFRDKRSGFYNTIFNSIDILVTRLPALLPFDIQKIS